MNSETKIKNDFETKINNALIAKFMGYQQIPVEAGTVYQNVASNFKFAFNTYVYEKGSGDYHITLHYHQDWDWLMKAWFKLMEWGIEEFGEIHYWQEISARSIAIIITKSSLTNDIIRFKKQISTDGDIDISIKQSYISKVYEVLVEGIKFHDQYVNDKL